MQTIKICHFEVFYSSGKTFKHFKFTMKFKFGIITVMEDFLRAKICWSAISVDIFGSRLMQTRVNNYESSKKTLQLLSNW